MKFKAFVTGNDTVVPFDVSQRGKSQLTLQTATVFWNFKNILTGVNDVVEDSDNPGTQITRLSNGYYTIRDIQSEFKSKDITLISNYHNSTCSIKSTKKSLKMGGLGELLGFDKDKVFTKGDWHHSGKVKVNHGLKYININVDAAVEDSVYDERGKRGNTITSLYIDTTQSLYGTKTDYKDIKENVPISSDFSSLRFSITTNIDWPVDVDALLNIEIT